MWRRLDKPWNKDMWEKIKGQIAKISLLQSLRVRIFLLLLVMGMVPGAITRSTLLNNYEERAVNVKISEVSNQFKIIANHLLRFCFGYFANARNKRRKNHYFGRGCKMF